MSDRFVLLVEDNADDELLAIRAFKKSNIKRDLVVVRDGQEALEFLFCTGKYTKRNKYHLPDFILLDLKLPKLDGPIVLDHIRKNEITKLLPVIILTSSQEDHDLQQCYLSGANSYVVKPLEAGSFVNLMQNLGTYWLDLNKSPQMRANTP